MERTKAFRCVAVALLVVAGGHLAAQDRPDRSLAFQWLEAGRPAAPLFHDTHQVAIAGLSESLDPRIQVEEEVIQSGPNSRQIKRRVYELDETGSRRLVEQVLEVQTTHPDGRQDAERTVSQPDLNGRLNVVEKRTQQTRPTGAGAFQTESTLYSRGGGGALEPFQFIRQTERKLGEHRVETQRTHYTIGGNQNWEAIEQRRSVSRSGAAGEWTSQEEIFRREYSTELSLSERSASREWKDGQGRLHRTTEIHQSDPAGRLTLDRRIRTTLEEVAEGGTRAVHEIERRNPVAPMESLQLFERRVETLEDLTSGGERRRVEVQGRDASGRLESVLVMEETRQVEETHSGHQSRTRSEFERSPR